MNLILFDLDNTLFDVHTWFQEFLFPMVAEAADVTQERVTQAYVEYRDTLDKPTDFEPEQFFSWINVELGIELAEIEQLFYSPQAFRKSVFADVVPALTALKDAYRLGIFSEGFTSFQQRKLELSGLLPFFDPQSILIHRRKLEETVLESLPHAIIVDDRKDVVDVVATYENLTPIWLNRRDQAVDDSISTIGSLRQLADVLPHD